MIPIHCQHLFTKLSANRTDLLVSPATSGDDESFWPSTWPSPVLAAEDVARRLGKVHDLHRCCSSFAVATSRMNPSYELIVVIPRCEAVVEYHVRMRVPTRGVSEDGGLVE